MTDNANIQHKSTFNMNEGHAYSDDGKRIPVVEFNFEALDGEQSEDTGNRSSRETVSRLLEFLTREAGSPREIGLRLLAFQHLTGSQASHSDLAKRMELDRSVVCRRLQAMRKELGLAHHA